MAHCVYPEQMECGFSSSIWYKRYVKCNSRSIYNVEKIECKADETHVTNTNGYGDSPFSVYCNLTTSGMEVFEIC